MMLPEDDAAVKYLPDSEAALAVDGASVANGSKAGLPSTSANAAVKTQKEEKAKKEKPNAVGTFELVKF